MVKVYLTCGRMDSSDLCWQQDKPIRKNIIEATNSTSIIFHLDVCYIWPVNLIRIIPSRQPSAISCLLRTQEHCALRKETYYVMLDSDDKLEMRLKYMFRRRIVSFGD